MTPLERITERLNRYGEFDEAGSPRLLLTLNEFFEGNHAIGCIGCNLTPTPTPPEFFELLKQIAARPDVADIRVEITMFDDPDWPFSDTVWVITTASVDQVASWFEEDIRPDDCFLGWGEGIEYEPCPIPAGMHPVCCWWD